MKVAFTLVCICLITACSSKLEPVHYTTYGSGDLVHTVILTLKSTTTENRRTEIIDLLTSLKQVKGTIGLFTALRAKTPDPRAKQNYDIVLQMAFKNKDDLARYSEDSYHLEVRNKLKHDLSAPPIVYDYWAN